jgi:hypothetical protein
MTRIANPTTALGMFSFLLAGQNAFATWHALTVPSPRKCTHGRRSRSAQACKYCLSTAGVFCNIAWPVCMTSCGPDTRALSKTSRSRLG